MARHEMRSAYDEVEVEDTLLLKDFQPVTVLKQEIHVPEKARFPAVDSHVHLDEKEGRVPKAILRSWMKPESRLAFRFSSLKAGKRSNTSNVSALLIPDGSRWSCG